MKAGKSRCTKALCLCWLGPCRWLGKLTPPTGLPQAKGSWSRCPCPCPARPRCGH